MKTNERHTLNHSSLFHYCEIFNPLHYGKNLLIGTMANSAGLQCLLRSKQFQGQKYIILKVIIKFGWHPLQILSRQIHTSLYFKGPRTVLMNDCP